MQKSFTTLWQESKEDLIGLFKTKKSLLTLNVLEKGVPAGIKAGFAVVLVVLSLFLLSFLLTAGALGFSLLFVDEMFLTVLRSLTFGFLCLSGCILLLMLILLAIKGVVVKKVTTSVMLNYLEKQEQAEQEAPQQPNVEVKDQNGDTIKPIRYYEE